MDMFSSNLALTPADVAAVRRWFCRMLVGGLIATGLLVLPALYRASNGGLAIAQERPRAQPCAEWDDLASEAIKRLVQTGDNVDLRQVGDALTLMRRARRNCQGGWVALACQDYHAIMGAAPGVPPVPTCAQALLDSRP